MLDLQLAQRSILPSVSSFAENDSNFTTTQVYGKTLIKSHFETQRPLKIVPPD